MIGTIEIKVNAAKPNFPLQPMFAFQGSPSSIRVLEVPKKIGDWNITNVKVVAQYPDNTTIEKVAVRTGSVWVATFDGCEIAGKVGNGLSILADGIDEDGNEVSGYVLGKGDVFILENDTDISRLLEKTQVRYIDDIPDVPTKGDLMNSNGELKLFDGNDWIEISTEEPQEVYDTQITIQKNGTPVGTFSLNQPDPKAIDVPVPSRTSDIVNDSGFITVEAIPSKVSSFENDVGYITESAIPSNVGAFQNDVGYLTSVSWGEVQDKPDVALKSDLPSKVSELDNDAGYLSAVSWNIVTDKPAIPSATSDLTNDSGFITESAIPSNVSEFNNDAGYITTNALPTKVSELENDSGFITLAQVPPVPSNLSEYNNDVGFITASAIPSNVGAFTNDVGYLTTSSQAFVDKRDKTDMSAVVGTTYASWNLSALHSTTYSPALELKWGTYNVFGQKQECWLVDDEYRQLCFFLMPDLTMLFWGVKNQDGSYIAGYGESITLSSDELSIATINGVAEITCTRTSKDGSPEISTIATLKDLSEYEGAQGKRDWWDNTYPASVDDSGKYTINNFSVMVGSNSYVLDQFSKSGSTSTWKTTGGDYPSITTTDGLNFALNTDSSTYSNFSISQLKPGPATGTIGGSNYSALANFKLTTFALKDYVDAQVTSIPSATSDLVNDSGFITASAIPSNVGAFTNDAGYLTAASTTIQNLQNKDLDHELRIREVEKQATGARDWMDLSYPTVNANIQDGFGIHGFTVDFPSYGEHPSTSDYMSFYSVVSGTARWRNVNGTLEMKTGDGTHFSYWNADSWSDFPLNNTSPTEAWTFYLNGGIRPAYITASFKSNTMKKIALEDYVNAQISSAIPSNVSELNNDVGYLTASDVSTSALYPSSPYSAYVQIDDYGEVNAKKLVNETGVWFVKAVMDMYTTDPVTGYWVSPPKATDDGTNILVEIWVQDIGRVYGPMKVSHLASSSTTEISMPVNYHNVGFRVQLKKSTQADIPLWIDYGRLVRDGDANSGLRISQIEDDIGLIHDISEKRDLTDISYPASVDSTGMYTISEFTVDGVSYDVFGTGYPSTGNSYWTDDGEQNTNCVWTSNGTNYQLRLSGTDFGSTFSFQQLKSGSVVVTSSSVSHTVTATFKQTTFALKDYVDAQIGNVLNEQF